MLYLFITIILFIAILIYFRIAERYDIVDKPNERSSHEELTIRGGGIIFLIVILIIGMILPAYWLPVLGAVIIGVISFLDDRITLSSRIRLIFHLLAVTTLFYFLQIFDVFIWWNIGILYIILIGIINAYNFMDGINGMTGLYSFIVLLGLQYVNLFQFLFVDPDLIWLPIISCFVFLFFNFRRRAKCFAGDVGSVTIAFWITFLLLKLIIFSENPAYILFLIVYGIDSVFTIIHRLILKQNIFDAHRLHFYQILANEQKIPHLLISGLYATIQVFVIGIVIFSSFNYITLIFIILIPLIAVYILMKWKLMNKIIV